MPTDEVKCCSICRAVKPVSEFQKRKNRPSGLTSECKACIYERTKRWRKANPGKLKAQSNRYRQVHYDQVRDRERRYSDGHKEQTKDRGQRWVEANPDKQRERIRRYDKSNPEQAKERQRRYRQNNPEKSRDQQRRRYRANPGIVIARIHRRRARKLQLPDTLTAADRARCLDYWGHKCAYCGNPSVLDMEHYVSLTNPDCPGTIPTNILPACQSCNASKRDKDAAEWLAHKFGDEQAQAILERIKIYFEWVTNQPHD